MSPARGALTRQAVPVGTRFGSKRKIVWWRVCALAVVDVVAIGLLAYSIMNDGGTRVRASDAALAAPGSDSVATVAAPVPETTPAPTTPVTTTPETTTLETMTLETTTLPATTVPVTPAPDPTSPATTVAPVPAAPVRATMVFAGDVLIHDAVWRAAAIDGGYDFSPLLAPVQEMISSADLAICHMEGTLGAPGAPPSGFPRFSAPPTLAVDLKEAGFDGCSIASNHSFDRGARGVSDTIAGFESAGLAHAGSALEPGGASSARYDVKGIAVVQLSYTYGSNGAVPAALGHLLNIIDSARILADAAEARANGAQIVVVSLHWGEEYDHNITAAQLKVADALAAQPGVIDLVVGHHAHVVEPIARVGDLWVAFGMGNFLSNNWAECCRNEVTDGVIVSATIEADGNGSAHVVAVDYTPTWNGRDNYTVRLVERALIDGNSDVSAAVLRASFDRTTAYVTGASGEARGLPTIAAKNRPG